jgi:hypothetical protein
LLLVSTSFVFGSSQRGADGTSQVVLDGELVEGEVKSGSYESSARFFLWLHNLDAVDLVCWPTSWAAARLLEILVHLLRSYRFQHSLHLPHFAQSPLISHHCFPGFHS